MTSRNRTLTLTPEEEGLLGEEIIRKVDALLEWRAIDNKIIHGDWFEVAPCLPTQCVDLLIIDPPYNLTKQYGDNAFKAMTGKEYQAWFCQLMASDQPLLKPTASVYVCSDWKTSVLIAPILQDFFKVQNRITWEREKGRGSKTNWKNNLEDIWFCTLSNDYFFDVDAVKLKKKVIAPYKNEQGEAKDWQKEEEGAFRLTHPSNCWTDISIPFWSMPENTEHPTQKPEKLIAKLILASSKENDVVFDPFLGSGTTAVVASKLGRHFSGVEHNLHYCCLAQKRLQMARTNKVIQGYDGSVFWERNSLNTRRIVRNVIE